MNGQFLYYHVNCSEMLTACRLPNGDILTATVVIFSKNVVNRRGQGSTTAPLQPNGKLTVLLRQHDKRSHGMQPKAGIPSKLAQSVNFRRCCY